MPINMDVLRGRIMGLWYFLILFLGLFFVIRGIFLKKSSLKKVSFIIVGIIFISFSIFMFSPGSVEIITDLFNLNK